MCSYTGNVHFVCCASQNNNNNVWQELDKYIEENAACLNVYCQFEYITMLHEIIVQWNYLTPTGHSDSAMEINYCMVGEWYGNAAWFLITLIGSLQ